MPAVFADGAARILAKRGLLEVLDVEMNKRAPRERALQRLAIQAPGRGYEDADWPSATSPTW
jgi:hypothetical protein